MALGGGRDLGRPLAGWTPIGADDLLIAGQGLRHDATLVTANTSESARVDGVRWEDWASPT